jgi:nucleoside-diphosphate-sugar epimerase
MIVLVTGATGFVGRSLIQRLADDGHVVVATCRDERQAVERDRIHWTRIDDIGPRTDWSRALGDADAVIHLAALAHQVGKLGEGRLDEFRAVNVEGARVLAQAALAAPTVRRFIFVSSIGAVTSASADVLDETTPCAPTTDYGLSKREGELAVAAALRDSRIDWCILRPPLVYGPANPGNMARLIDLIKRRWPLPFGAIRNRRSFIYVENLVDALAACLTRPLPSGRTFFVTDGTEFSTAELSRLLASHLQAPARIWNVPLSVLRLAGIAGDAVDKLAGRSIGIDTYSVERLAGSLSADGSEFRKALAWTPPFDPEHGIRATCAGLASGRLPE